MDCLLGMCKKPQVAVCGFLGEHGVIGCLNALCTAPVDRKIEFLAHKKIAVAQRLTAIPTF